MSDFDKMAERFTARVAEAANWKHSYFGAAYSTRIRTAILNLREAIEEAEQNPEIQPSLSRTSHYSGGFHDND